MMMMEEALYGPGRTGLEPKWLQMVFSSTLLPPPAKSHATVGGVRELSFTIWPVLSHCSPRCREPALYADYKREVIR